MNKKPTNTNQLAEYFGLLGLSTDAVRVMVSLVQFGKQTKLELSRSSGINRTNVYRIVEDLRKQGLVEDILDEHTTFVSAVGLEAIRQRVSVREKEIAKLKELFPAIEAMFSLQKSIEDRLTKVLFYRGSEGIRQMAWNNLKAKGEILGYTYRPYVEILGEKFFIEWSKELKLRQITVRDICDEKYAYAKAMAKSQVVMDAQVNQTRYIGSSLLTIDHQLDIYNDTVAIYNWHEGEVFGVEIINAKVAKFQRQLFELIWQMALPEKV